MKKIGVYSFFIGVLMMVFYTIIVLFQDSEVNLWVKLSIALMITGFILIIVNQIKDRKKEKEEEHDSSKY
mgnify:CR=1 FL=1